SEEPLAQANSEGIELGKVLSYGREVGGPALRALGFAKRAELLLALSKAIHAHRDELLELSIQNAGTTRGDAKFDVDGATGTLAAYAQFGKELGERPFFADGAQVQLG